MCHGALRLSEDLDFSAGRRSQEVSLDGMEESVTEGLLSKFDVRVRLKRPKDKPREFSDGVQMKRWYLIVDTDPDRSDIPSQRVKIEVSTSPHETCETRPVDMQIPGLDDEFEGLEVRCEALNEVFADKIISFASSTPHIRYRDVWDLDWISSQDGFDLSQAASLAEVKYGVYETGFGSVSKLLSEGVKRASLIWADPEFADQIRRSLPPTALEERGCDVRVLGDEVSALYGLVAQDLGVTLDDEALGCLHEKGLLSEPSVDDPLVGDDLEFGRGGDFPER